METLTAILDFVSLPLTMGIAVLGFMRTTKKDAKEDGAQNATMMSELGYIKSGIDDVKAEQRQQRSWNEAMATRMAQVEASAKQAHRRLDEMHGEYRARE